MSTLVAIGNAHQPFRRLLDQVCRVASQLPQPVLVQHGHTPFECAACSVSAFMDMDRFEGHMCAAELVIVHAGAGSVIQAVQAGKIPVVMPRRVAFGEHINDHQLEFARVLARAGKIVIAMEPEQLLAATQEALRLQRDAITKIAAQRPEPRMVSLLRMALDEYSKKLN